MKIKTNPFFIKSDAGNLFVIHYQPADAGNDIGIVYFPPFAEEMNKCRHLASIQARNFAKLGCQVVMLDLYGTGDSEGDFSDGCWEYWQENLESSIELLKSKGCKKFVFWGTRVGAILALDVLPKYRDEVLYLLFWQPVLKGEVALTQFLRLKIATEILSGKQASTKVLKDKLNQGEIVEVAGYGLNSDIANGLQNRSLRNLVKPDSPPIHILEMVADSDKSISVATRKLSESIAARGVEISINKVVGEQFWITPEISIVDSLLIQTDQIVKERMN